MKKTRSMMTPFFYCVIIVRMGAAILPAGAGPIFIDTLRALTRRSCVISVQGIKKSSRTNTVSSLYRSYESMRSLEMIILAQLTRVVSEDIPSVDSAGNDSMETMSCTLTAETSMKGATFVIGIIREESSNTS